jgi:glycosyltransferase involved in cell wall biosynthesis
MDKKISVIVPVYNNEKFLERCINSIINQSYKNIEIIIVNDGSTDGSAEICDNFEDDRVIVKHKVNKGVSAARNDGIAIATGEYISFVDSDDWIEPHMFLNLLNEMIKTNADIAVSGINFYSPNENQTVYKQYHSNDIQIYETEKALQSLLTYNKNKQMAIMVCNKLYKRSLFNGVRFPENISFGEDDVVSTKLMLGAMKVIHLDKAYYNCFLSENSLSRSTFSKNKLGVICARTIVYKSLSNYDNIRILAYKRLLEGIALSLSEFLKPPNKYDSNVFKIIFEEYQKVKKFDDFQKVKANCKYINKIENRLRFPHTYRFIYFIHSILKK